MFRHYRVILERQSVVKGKSVSEGVDLGGRRTIQKKNDSQRFYVSSDIIVVEIHFAIYVTFICYYFAL
jgi:hypothetical protein